MGGSVTFRMGNGWGSSSVESRGGKCATGWERGGEGMDDEERDVGVDDEGACLWDRVDYRDRGDEEG
jgi:hypothetical protein